MKKTILLAVLYFGLMNFHANAQRKASANEDIFGSHFNLGLGLGYYGYVENALPAVVFNYEFDVASNVTVAPFIGFYSYSSNSHRETVIPIGAKGYYYFDKLLNAESKWDFYGAASLGFSMSSVTSNSPLYIDIHIGSRYHLNEKMSLFLDLSSRASTIGITF